MEVPSLDGFCYFISFLDHSSDHIVPVFSAQKLVLPIQQQFKVYQAKNKVITGNDLQIWWTDGGGKFESKSTKKLLEELGITHQTTCPHTPEQNGKAELFNRTIIEHACSILHATHVPRKLWVEIFRFICIMYNMTPTKNTPNSTLREEFYDRKDKFFPTENDLQRYGCIAYPHEPKVGRSKLDAASELHILVGYAPTSKAYRLWNPRTNAVIEETSVRFDESRTYKDLDLPTDALKCFGKEPGSTTKTTNLNLKIKIPERSTQTAVRFRTHNLPTGPQKSRMRKVDAGN
jgi:hypothetical protein